MKTILALFALFAFAGNVFGSELSSLDERLIQKSSDGDLEAVADLLESGADVNATNRQLETPLSVAAEANHKKIVELLVENGASLTVGEAAANAAQGGYIEIVKFLLDKGMDVNAPCIGGSILSRAVSGGHFEIVEFLLDRGADINLDDGEGYTALYTASGTSAEMVKFLLKHGAEVDAMVWNKSTPLLNAASYGLTDAVELLANAGGNLNAKTDLGDTALIRAAIMGQTQTAEWLINHGADMNERKNNGNTALMEAASLDRVEVVKLLLERGANPFAVNDAGDTALDIAKQNNSAETIALLEKCETDAKESADKEEEAEVVTRAIQDGGIEKGFSSKYVFALIGIAIVFSAFVVIFILLAKKRRDKIQ